MKTIATLALALALSAGTAIAADAPSDEALMGEGVVVDDNVGNLDGFYATVFAVHIFGDGVNVNPSDGVGGTLGVSRVSGSFVYGGAVSAAAFFSGQMIGEYAVQAVARAGIVVADNVALSGLLGAGWETENDMPFLATGLSLDVGVTDNIGLRAQYQANYTQAGPGEWVHSLSGALLFHF